MLFGVYQDLVHQNPGDYLNGGITEDGKWQDRWKNLSVCQPNATMYRIENVGGDFGNLYVELDRVHTRKWNSERVLGFS